MRKLELSAARAAVQAAEADSHAMSEKKTADGETCDADILNKIDAKNATARVFAEARKGCPGYKCKSTTAAPQQLEENGQHLSYILRAFQSENVEFALDFCILKCKVLTTDLKMTDELVLVGTDDGVTFWSHAGHITTANGRGISIDFGVEGVWNGTLTPNGVEWQQLEHEDRRQSLAERSGWAHQSVRNLTSVHAPALGVPGHDTVSGIYVDLSYYDSNGSSFKGLRMVSQGVGGALVVVGSNDGEDWWSLTGRIATGGGAAALELDFSQQEHCAAQHDIPGCNYTALYTEDTILFDATGHTCATIVRGQWEWTKFDALED